MIIMIIIRRYDNEIKICSYLISYEISEPDIRLCEQAFKHVSRLQALLRRECHEEIGNLLEQKARNS